MKSIKLDSNVTIRFWTHRPDTRRTIIMIHGFTGSHRGFQYIEPLLPDHRIIIPDLPGFGESDLPRQEDWSIPGIARLANEFVRSLELPEPPIILGHSMGGLVVSAMISQEPDLFDEVILISPVPTPIRLNDKRRPGAVLGALQYRIGARTRRAGDKLVRSRTISRVSTYMMTHTSDKERRTAIREHHFENLDLISSIHFYEKLYSDINRRGAIDYQKVLSKKRTLLIVGDKDIVTPLKEEQKLRGAIQPEKFVVIPEVGHLIHYEKPSDAAREIRSFIPK